MKKWREGLLVIMIGALLAGCAERQAAEPPKPVAGVQIHDRETESGQEKTDEKIREKEEQKKASGEDLQQEQEQKQEESKQEGQGSEEQKQENQSQEGQKAEEQKTDQQSGQQEKETTSGKGIRAEFQAAMDAYEAFYDEYCELMKKYKENPTDRTILSAYLTMMEKVVEMDEKFEAWEDDEDMTTEELKYYLEVTNRIMQKMIDLTQ